MDYKGYSISVSGVKPVGSKYWEASYAITRLGVARSRQRAHYGAVAGAFDSLQQVEAEAYRIAQAWIDEQATGA